VVFPQSEYSEHPQNVSPILESCFIGGARASPRVYGCWQATQLVIYILL